jgi:NarL family two-component system response regulator LiaR
LASGPDCGTVSQVTPPRPLPVIVITANDTVGRQLRRALAGEGLCAVAGDPTEPASVVGVAHRANARVALVDLDLPHAGGLAMLAALRAVPYVAPLMFTRSPVPLALRPALERGAVGCLAGHVRPRRLALAVHAAGRGESVLSAALTHQLLRELTSGGGRMLAARGVTPREREVLGLLAEGRRTCEVARDLTLSRETVRGHVKSVLRKLDVRTCAAAVALLVAEWHAQPDG